MAEITITINETTKSARASAIAVLYDEVSLILSGIGANLPVNLYAYVQLRGVSYADCSSFTADTEDFTKAVGILSLNTTPLRTAFANIHPDGVRNFPLTIVNTENDQAVAVCDFNIRNNPVVPSGDVTEIDEAWLHTHGNKEELDSITEDSLKDGISEVSIPDNATTNIVLGSIESYRSFNVEYTLNDGAKFRKGTIEILHNGTTAWINSRFFENSEISGISFNADISTGNVRLLVTTAAVGSSLTMNYQIVNKITI